MTFTSWHMHALSKWRMQSAAAPKQGVHARGSRRKLTFLLPILPPLTLQATDLKRMPFLTQSCSPTSCTRCKAVIFSATLLVYSSAFPYSSKIFPFGEFFSFWWNIFLLVKNFPQNVRATRNFLEMSELGKFFLSCRGKYFTKRKIFHQKEIFSPKGKYFTKRKNFPRKRISRWIHSMKLYSVLSVLTLYIMMHRSREARISAYHNRVCMCFRVCVQLFTPCHKSKQLVSVAYISPKLFLKALN